MFVLSGVDALRFRGNNIEEFGIFNGSSETLTSFSACLWMKTTDNSDQKMLSYAYGNVANGLVIWLDPKLIIIFDPEPDKRVQERYEIWLYLLEIHVSNIHITSNIY
jgi:hypothetical protein